MSFDTLPSKASLKVEPFQAKVSDQDLDDFKKLLKLSKIGPKTYENLRTDGYFGITREWLSNAKQHWETKYDWRACEKRLNSFPNFTTLIDYEGDSIDMHFVALFSQKPDAVPITLLHGWPGTILEFLGALDILRNKYKPADLPYHVIVPSLPGYGYSSGPPLNRDFTVEDIANVIDKLMHGLGFGSGYIAQGGDIGSFVSRVLGVNAEACKAVHLNLNIGVQQPDDMSFDQLSEVEKKGVARYEDFGAMGNAYAREHGTRPATIGLVLSASPIALLAWVGEKFLQWTDTDPPIDEILDSVTCYWFTDSFPRAIFPYRQFFGPNPTFFHNDPKYTLKVPFGYSWFPQELAPVPRAWVAKTGNMLWYKQHTEGGHFAAMEKPKLFVDDIESFVKDIWPKAK